MSPRSLLYSSDQETTRQLSQALQELALDVDHCPEIFAALQKVTARIYDVIAVDWDEGMEAGFFLKTASELKSNQNAFFIVVAKAQARADVRQVSARVVLSKPLLAAHAKYTLLTCNDFVSRMSAWPTPIEAHQAPARIVTLARTPRPSPSPGGPKVPVRSAVPSAVQANAPQSRMPEPPAFATLQSGLLEERPLNQVIKRTLTAQLIPFGRAARTSPMLRIATLAVAFFAVGYVFSEPLTRAAVSLGERSHNAWERASGTARVSQAPSQPAVEFAQNIDPDPQPAEPSSRARIHVLAVKETHGHSRRSQVETAAAVQSEQNQTPAATPSARIPQSLEAPFPGASTVRNIAAKVKPALLDSLEPVSLPGYLSDTLLVDRVEPTYPQEALRAGLQGPVVLHAWIARDGTIRDLKLIRGPLLLGEAACKAVKQWRYKPYMLNGEAVEAQTYVTVDFRLP